MEFTHEDLEKIAALSKLTIEEEKKGQFLKEFQSILGYFSTLQELPPRPSVGLTATKKPLRSDNEDLPDHFDAQEEIVQQFPREKDRLNVVPAIIKEHKDQRNK